MAKVVLKNVCKEYPGAVKAVRDANLEIADREFVVFVGPSGCGKSTTLRMIAGLEEITSGEILIGERVVNTVPPKDRDIAMVFQNYALYPHMTCYENMAFGLKLRHFSRAEIDQRVQEAAKILGITELLERQPRQLSGGQRQRVAVGRAIVRKPAAFLFDEPLSNLDAKLRVDMRVELNKLHTRLATTMIYVTHDQVEAMTLADRIVIMNKGEIQQVASPLALYDRPVNKYVAGFIGSPPMNFLRGSIVRAGGGGLSFTDGALSIALHPTLSTRIESHVDRPVFLGIRPEMVADRGGAREWAQAQFFKATVEVVEALGDHKVVHFSTAKSSFIGKLGAHIPAEVGQHFEVAFNAAHIHIFDASSEENLTCTGARYEPADAASLPTAPAGGKQ